MPLPIPKTEPRSPAVLQRHYEIEKALAERLRKASKDERRNLYSAVYDEFFSRVTDLPKQADSPEAQRHVVTLQARALDPFLSRESVFLEVGAGDCALALHVAGTARQVYAVEASAEAVANVEAPSRFELIVSDSIPLPFDEASIDVAYSCHFLEHLHPDDARDHAVEIHRVLRPGGVYLCVTPNRLWGPHDISRYFDDVPTGFHLREYTHTDLARLLRRAGFGAAQALKGIGQAPRLLSLWPYYASLEGFLSLLPVTLRRRAMARLFRHAQPPFRPLEQVMVVARR